MPDNIPRDGHELYIWLKTLLDNLEPILKEFDRKPGDLTPYRQAESTLKQSLDAEGEAQNQYKSAKEALDKAEIKIAATENALNTAIDTAIKIVNSFIDDLVRHENMSNKYRKMLGLSDPTITQSPVIHMFEALSEDSRDLPKVGDALSIFEITHGQRVTLSWRAYLADGSLMIRRRVSNGQPVPEKPSETLPREGILPVVPPESETTYILVVQDKIGQDVVSKELKFVFANHSSSEPASKGGGRGTFFGSRPGTK